MPCKIARIFPPCCPNCQTLAQSKGYERKGVVTRWGKAELRVKRWYCPECECYGHTNPPGLDGSGLSPAVLKNVVYLGSHMTYRESQKALGLQDIELSLGQVEQKHHGYAEVYEKECKDYLGNQAKRVLPAGGDQTWVVQIDGMFVMERDKPAPGQCEGREIKQAVMFAMETPEQRQYVSHAGEVEQFSPLVHGLQRHLGMHQQDLLVGLADGAVWIDRLFDELGVQIRILDVYHATEYLDIVMQAMGWDTVRREAHRDSWRWGDINARSWLKHHLPDPTVWLTWPEPTRQALRYLEERLDQMDYYDFKQKGYPIGSGVIEGAANSVMGARMCRSGMRWSHSGINRMASLRSEFASHQPILDFNNLRLLAFP